MSSSALIVVVVDTERKLRQTYRFVRSPVRFGRSALNDLPLDRSFVSHCHGVLHFGDARCEIVDLGSTNGTRVDGRRLLHDQGRELGVGSVVEIGTLELRVVLDGPAALENRGSHALRASELDESTACAAECGVAEDGRAIAGASKVRAGADGAAREPGARGANSAARANEALSRFAKSFIELRGTQRRFVRDLGLSAPARDPLEGFDDPAALLEYLLDPAGPEERLDQLSRAHANLMLHQIALVNGFSAGARELLLELSPEALSLRSMGGAIGWVLRLFGYDGRWRALRRRFDDLQEETALSRVLLGRAFARAYASAMARRERSPARPPADGKDVGRSIVRRTAVAPPAAGARSLAREADALSAVESARLAAASPARLRADWP